jgi:folate-dependent phosphoribosylglycinamide formyltransferase PurN
MARKKLRVGFLFTNGCSGAKYALKQKIEVSFLNRTWETSVFFTDNKDASSLHYFQNTKLIDYNDWYLSAKGLYAQDLKLEDIYFKEVANFFTSFNTDLIVLSGFMRKVPKSFIEKFPNIINIHPADLRVLDENNKRKYKGKDPVTLAINAGEKMTHSTIHFINEHFDEGEIVCISDGLLVEERTAEEQQTLMKDMCDGPALLTAIKGFADGTFSLKVF